MASLPDACTRVAEAASRLGTAITIEIMEDSTRTAEKAAAACNVEVGQIVKSLVFQGETSGNAVLLLVSGSNRVDEKLVAKAIGEKIRRPDADFVRNASGFAIGGIPPFGHATAIATWIDRDLLQFSRIFAAAGTPNAIFAIAPAELQRLASAQAIQVASRSG